MKRFLQGNWSQIKGKLKQKHSKLTNDDLEYVEGKEEELLNRLEAKLDKSRTELISELKQQITS